MDTRDLEIEVVHVRGFRMESFVGESISSVNTNPWSPESYILHAQFSVKVVTDMMNHSSPLEGT